MVSVSHWVSKLLADEPFLQEALSRKIVNYGALAMELRPKIERELGSEIKVSAIAMALHRFAEKQRLVRKVPGFSLHSEITLRTGLVDITLARSGMLINRIRQLFSRENLEHGDFFNIIWGTREVGVITDEKHLGEAKKVFAEERILNVEMDLVAISMTFGKDFFYSPGAIARVTHELAWHHINLFEVISTMTEFTVLVKKKDTTRAFDVLNVLFKRLKQEK